MPPLTSRTSRDSTANGTGGARTQAAALLLAMIGCQQTLGEVDIEGVVASSRPDAGMAGAAAAPELGCAEGEFECAGAALRLCDGDPLAFRTVLVCSHPALCDAAGGRCRTPTCLPGSYECLTTNSMTALRFCQESGDSWRSVATCQSEAHCNASLGRCTDEPCAAEVDAQCNARELQVCGDSGWVTQEFCRAPALCDPVSRACKLSGCRVGEELFPFRCDGPEFQSCSDDETGFEFVETCTNDLSCDYLFDDPDVIGTVRVGELPVEKLQRLGCEPPSCTPGRWACRQATVARCGVNRRGYVADAQTCPSPGHCDARRGSCSAEPCEDDATQCSGSEWQTCETGAWIARQDCGMASLCDHDRGCQSPTCRAGDYDCEGSTLRRCNIDGTGWVDVQVCATEQLCDAPAKRCYPPVCGPGDRWCDPNGAWKSCDPGRDGWTTRTDCSRTTAAQEIPQALWSGLCDPMRGCLEEAQCETDSFRCNGAGLERCQTLIIGSGSNESRGNAWLPFSDCQTAELCDAAGRCIPPACQAGEARCVATTESTDAGTREGTTGSRLEVCDSAQLGFELKQACSEDEWCDAEHQQCDRCQAFESVCLGDRLHTCSADGLELEFERVCAGGCGPVGQSFGCLPVGG